jgi:hypothetical protein
MEKEKQLLTECRRLIEESLNWGDSSTWSNDDFEQLSEKIFEKTKVQLSISTLKRIWGKVRYENFPTTATLNALTGFLGYDSWRAFKQKNSVSEPKKTAENTIPPTVENAPAIPKEETKAQPRKSYKPFIIIAIVLIAAGIFYMSFKKRSVYVDLSKVKFEAVKVSDTLPNSVVFNYDASVFKSDSVYIQQSWDPTRREQVDGNGKQYTSIYYNPGYFLAKLIVDNQVKKECVVSIKTKGWKGIIEQKPVPIYLSAREIKGKGFMGISDSLFHAKIGLPVFNDTWVKFANVQEFKGIDAGNFTLETTFRNASAVEASVCRKVNVVLLGQGTATVIAFSDKGCISDLNLLNAGNYISGKDHDMSAFGCDFSQFQNLKCNVENHHLKIYLNGKLILDTPQKETLGKIQGIRFEFEGAGQVKYVKLATTGAGVYEDHFDRD